MRTPVILLALVSGLSAQTTVWLRSSGPAAALITNAQSNGATIKLTAQITGQSSDGLPSGCGTSQLCVGIVQGVVNTAGATYADGIRTLSYLDATHIALYDMTGICTSGPPCTGSPLLGNALAWSGTYYQGGTAGGPAGTSWVAMLNPFSLPAGINGWLDGANGNLMHKLVIAPGNGTTTGPNGMASTGGLTLSGCPSACVISVTTNSYNPATATLPLEAGNYFSVFGTGTVLDSTNASGCAGAGTVALPLPYTVASVSSSGWTSTPFSCSISNGDYTNSNPQCGPASSPNGAIGGTQSCTTVSQMAYANASCATVGHVTSSANAAWCWLAHERGQFDTDDTADTGWKNIFDGAVSACPVNPCIWSPPSIGVYALSALGFLVDRSNTVLARNLHYYFNENEMSGGVSWIDDETNGSAGGSGDQQQYYGMFLTAGLIFGVWAPYEAPSSIYTHLNKTYNDVYDPNYTVSKAGVELSSTNAVNGTITYYSAAGTTLAAPSCSGLNCTFALQSGSSAVVNQILWLSASSPLGGNTANFGYITSISGCTGGSCSVTAAMYQNPAASTTPYLIYASITWGPSGTLTGGALSNFTLAGATTSQLNIHVGGVVMQAIYPYAAITEYLCKVVSVTTTGGTCYNGYNIPHTQNTTTYATAWYFPPMSVCSAGVTNSACSGNMGNPGQIWQYKHIAGQEYGSQPSLYPATGGTNTILDSSHGIVSFDINQFGMISAARMAMDMAAAQYGEYRALVDLARMQSAFWDFVLPNQMAYATGGKLHDGIQYQGLVSQGNTLVLWLMGLNFSASSSTPFPSLSPAGSWTDYAKWEEFTMLADFYSNGNSGQGQNYGDGAYPGNSQVYQAGGGDSNNAAAYAWYPQFWFAPASASSQYHANWLTNILGGSFNLFWGDTLGLLPLFYDPRINQTALNYQSQPWQYGFYVSNQPAVAAVTGAGFPASVPGMQNISMASHTGWNNNGGSNSGGTMAIARFAAFSQGHDCFGPETGAYKKGKLFGVDESQQANLCDESVMGSSVNVGGFGVAQWNGDYPLTSNESTVSLNAWASAKAGSLGAQYGDQNSNYAHMCADVAGLYIPSLGVTSALKCFSHLKQHGSGTWDEWIVEQDETFLASPNHLQRSIHFTQNGSNPGNLPDNAYNTGTTICTDLSGNPVSCATSLNTYGRIEETELTAQGFGLITQIYSPSAIDMVWACPGSGNAPQCSTSNVAQRLGNSFGGGTSDPVMIASGSTLGTSTATALELVIVHKIMKYNGTNWDAAFHSAPLNPSASWTGADACGTNSAIGYLRYRGDGPSAAVPGFVTGTGATSACASLPYQYLMSGLTAGTYAVTLNGTPVSGSPFTVAAGDTSIEFTGTAGAVSINGSAPSSGPSASTSMAGQVTASGSFVIH